ncbi:MAG: protoporphyrinogen oxidase [Tannerellaceae bacterium]|nr:protoporphyrinogen oxidase [Tannerellaceae bacterium]
MREKEVDIVIIGAGLTGLTAAFHLRRKGVKVLVLEREERIGGQIRTFNTEDFVFESGPNTGAVSHPEVAELFQLLAPDCELETAKEEAKRRLIWKGNHFHELPCGLIGGVTTPLFSWYDKFRIWGEPFRAKGTDPDEPVGLLARRRLGESYLNYAVDPFVSGVYAGDPMKLTTRFALPKLYNLEQQYGSFIKGAMAKAKEPKSERDKLATKKVFSVKGGLENLIRALGKNIGEENIRLSTKDIRVNPSGDSWEVITTVPEGNLKIKAGKVITTVGAYSLVDLLPFIPERELEAITELTYAPVIQVSVGIKNTESLRFNAFGGLIPSCEKKDVLGILFPAACFEGRAPEEGAVFSFFLGGVKHSELLQLPDEEIENLIRKGLTELLKFPSSKALDMIRIFRHSRAIPQYGIDTGKRLAKIEELQKTYPGLTLAGNIRDGIGMADRIKQGTLLSYS